MDIQHLSPNVRSFLESLLKALPVDTSDPEIKDQLLADLAAEFNNFIINEILLQLPEDKRKEYAQLVEKNAAPEEVNAFLAPYVGGDTNEFYGKTAQKFAQLYIDAQKQT